MSVLSKILSRLLVTVVLLLFTGAVTHTAFVQAGELPSVHPGYPEVFDALGAIEAIEGDIIVVNDASLGLLNTTVYHSPYGIISLSDLKLGDRVGLILTEDRRVESLWKIAEGKNQKNTTKPKHRSQLRFENGVWKN